MIEPEQLAVLLLIYDCDGPHGDAEDSGFYPAMTLADYHEMLLSPHDGNCVKEPQVCYCHWAQDAKLKAYKIARRFRSEPVTVKAMQRALWAVEDYADEPDQEEARLWCRHHTEWLVEKLKEPPRPENTPAPGEGRHSPEKLDKMVEIIRRA